MSDYTVDEQTAAYIGEELDKLEEFDRGELDERIRLDYENAKIEKTSRICRQFLESDIGRFIHAKAIDHAENAREELVKLDMKDFKSKDHFLDKIKSLQYEAHMPVMILTWLNDAIRTAEEELVLKNEE